MLCILHHFDTQTVKNSALCRKAARRCSANGTCACCLTVYRGIVAMLTHINNSGTQSRLDFTLCVGVCVALCQHSPARSNNRRHNHSHKEDWHGRIQALELWELAGDVGSYTPPYFATFAPSHVPNSIRCFSSSTHELSSGRVANALLPKFCS